MVRTTEPCVLHPSSEPAIYMLAAGSTCSLCIASLQLQQVFLPLIACAPHTVGLHPVLARGNKRNYSTQSRGIARGIDRGYFFMQTMCASLLSKIAKFIPKLSCLAQCCPSTIKTSNSVPKLFKLAQLHQFADVAHHVGCLVTTQSP